MAILSPLARALVVALIGAVAPTMVPSTAPGIGRLPSCELGDVYTVPRGYDDWSVTLVDRLLRVESDYVPPDLVDVREAGIRGGGRIRAVAIPDTRSMARAARAAGAPIGVWSAYRSHDQQRGLFTMYTNANGFDSAITYSQRPGHSEHQLGLGVDFMSAGGGSPLPGDWGRTPAGSWMRENSWKYGWVNSYPRGDGGTRWNDRACFRYEPWHYRYLGREVAKKVHDSGLTIREYLWRHHTLLDRNGRQVEAPTPAASAPTKSATPSGVPTSTPSTSLSTPAPGPSTAPAAQPGPRAERDMASVDPAGPERFAVVAGLAALALLVTAAALIVRRRKG